jgi:hypothetical protein
VHRRKLTAKLLRGNEGSLLFPEVEKIIQLNNLILITYITLTVDGIILKCIVKKKYRRVWTGFTRLRIGTSGGLL